MWDHDVGGEKAGIVAADDVPTTLFCLEAYVEKVEKLPAKLKGEHLPAFAIRFLDYAPVIVSPPSVLTCSRSAFWYGQGKRCLFEEQADVLRKALRKRSAAALLVLQIEKRGENASAGSGRRRLYGSGTVSLSDFCGDDDEEEQGPHGAVKTWGRRQCKLAVTNSYDKVVGVVSLSISLSSFDPALRAVLAPPPPPPYFDQPTQEVPCHIIEEESATFGKGLVDRSSSTFSSSKSTPPMSPPSVQSSSIGFTHSSLTDKLAATEKSPPPSPLELAPGDEHCVDATLRMPQASTAMFDEERRSILSDSLAQSARVQSAEILSWREGSLIVDARIRFGDDRRGATMFADKLVFGPDPYLVPYDIFGPFKVVDTAVKRCRVALAPPPSPPPEQTAPVSRVTLDEDDPVRRAPRIVSDNRTLDVFRGKSSCFGEDDDLGECPPPLFLEARRRCRSTGDLFPANTELQGLYQPVPPPQRRKKNNARSPKLGPSSSSPQFPSENIDVPGRLQELDEHHDGPPPPPHTPEAEEELNAAYRAVRGKDGLVTLTDLMRATSLFDKKTYLVGDPALVSDNSKAQPQAPRRRMTYDDALALISSPDHI